MDITQLGEKAYDTDLNILENVGEEVLATRLLDAAAAGDLNMVIASNEKVTFSHTLLGQDADPRRRRPGVTPRLRRAYGPSPCGSGGTPSCDAFPIAIS